MPTDKPTDKDHPPSQPQSSTDRQGGGQSGYAAGRTRDPAQQREVQTQNPADTQGDEDDAGKHGLGTDDRFTGRGGPVTEDGNDDAADD